MSKLKNPVQLADIPKIRCALRNAISWQQSILESYGNCLEDKTWADEIRYTKAQIEAYQKMLKAYGG